MSISFISVSPGARCVVVVWEKVLGKYVPTIKKTYYLPLTGAIRAGELVGRLEELVDGEDLRGKPLIIKEFTRASIERNPTFSLFAEIGGMVQGWAAARGMAIIQFKLPEVYRALKLQSNPQAIQQTVRAHLGIDADDAQMCQALLLGLKYIKDVTRE